MSLRPPKRSQFMSLVVATLAAVLIPLSSCSLSSSGGGSDDDDGGTIAAGEYAVFAWNDLGMHCLNPTYDALVILPPYNTLWVQVVKRGNPPKVVTADIVVEYRLAGNTSSADKRSYGQFWDNAESLFGAVGLADDTGLNLEDPDIHNGLSGTMVLKADHFQANGIPVVPVYDDGTWDPYQQAIITVKDGSGVVLATTRTTVPTSDEINCAACHGTGSIGSAFQDIIDSHDAAESTDLASAEPVLCASCHGSPALGSVDAGSSGVYLSEAIHGFHSSKGAACYDCHPGAATQCSRSLAHTASNGNCASCHGLMSLVASSIASGDRIPWAEEPACASCHVSASSATLTTVSAGTSTIPEVDTGVELYRNAVGHGGMYCAACHGSPHAMVPSDEAKDNYQALQYQDKSVTIGTCEVCHSTSHGGGFSEFFEEHGGSSGKTSACKVCHTGFPAGASTASAPHRFGWRTR